MSDDMPEFLTSLDEGTMQLHEMFTSMVDRGFKEWQACFVLGVFIATMTLQANQEGSE